MADQKRSDPSAISIDPSTDQVSGFIADTDAVFARLSAFVDEYQDAKVDRWVSGEIHLTREVSRVSDVAVELVELSDALIDAKAQLFGRDGAEMARELIALVGLATEPPTSCEEASALTLATALS